MKVKELLSIDPSEYAPKLAEFRKELVKLNAQASMGTAMKNPGQLKQTKKNIARMMTLINQQKMNQKEAKKA